MIEIKVYVPEYFNKFRCIAGECPDTCCVGWEVDIDSATSEKYLSVSGEIGEKIRKNLARDEEGDEIFTLCEGDRCPFLNSCNLCEIHMTVGEDFLSKTCKLFPRFFDDFGLFREMGLGFGCPEGARIMLSDEENFGLVLHEECEEESEEVDEIFLEELISLRKEMFNVLENKNLSFEEKVVRVLSLARDFQEETDGEFFSDETQGRNFSDCIKILENMEYIKEERKLFLQKIKNIKSSGEIMKTYQSDFEKLMKYYIFRYLLKAVYDYDVLTKVKYGAFACIVISRIYAFFENPAFETRVKIMYSFSKEVEYSDVNIDFLDESLYNSFGTDDLLSLVRE